MSIMHIPSDLEEDIFASSIDGAAVMKKYYFPRDALCYNHGIHLAIVGEFNKNKNNEQDTSSDVDNYEDESKRNNISDTSFEIIENRVDSNLNDDISHIISKIFHRSYVRNNCLHHMTAINRINRLNKRVKNREPSVFK